MPDSSTLEVGTAVSPLLDELGPLVGETHPQPASLKTALSEDSVRRLEWRWLVKRSSGKGPVREVTHVGKVLKV